MHMCICKLMGSLTRLLIDFYGSFEGIRSMRKHKVVVPSSEAACVSFRTIRSINKMGFLLVSLFTYAFMSAAFKEPQGGCLMCANCSPKENIYVFCLN